MKKIMRKTQRKKNNKLQFSKMIPGPYGAKKKNNGVDFQTRFCHVSL